mmetsp:Transcript_29768/g.81952  ORF Transcript_29768/g.81952 Transcript_29768/m.81952 type:complete len:241 (-) Transcript_29768:1000-1722(-)
MIRQPSMIWRRRSRAQGRRQHHPQPAHWRRVWSSSVHWPMCAASPGALAAWATDAWGPLGPGATCCWWSCGRQRLSPVAGCDALTQFCAVHGHRQASPVRWAPHRRSSQMAALASGWLGQTLWAQPPVAPGQRRCLKRCAPCRRVAQPGASQSHGSSAPLSQRCMVPARATGAWRRGMSGSPGAVRYASLRRASWTQCSAPACCTSTTSWLASAPSLPGISHRKAGQCRAAVVLRLTSSR